MSLSYIRLHMLLVGLLPAAFAILVIGVGYVVSRIPQVEESVLQRAVAVAESLALASEFAVATEDRDQLAPLLASAFTTPDIVAVRVYRRDNSLLGMRQRDESPSQANYLESLMHRVFSSHPLRVRQRINIIATPLHAGFGLPEDAPATSPSVGALEIEVSLLATTREQLDIIENVLLTGGLLFIITAAFAARLGRSITLPLLGLTQTVNALARDDYASRNETGARGELRVLRDGINRMAAHIQTEQDRLQHKVREATEDLQRTVAELHDKTLEADEQRRAAEQASAFKSRFVANVSHEIRTPLNAILGYAELLERQLEEPHQRHHLATLQRSASNLLELLNDLLDFSRLESGSMPWDITELDLNDLLNNLRDEYASQAQSRGIEYFVRNLPAEVCAIRSDPLRVRQALVNLISNAIKFTHSGHVLVDAECVSRSAAQVTLRFRICDSGIGIDQEDLQSLFTAFSQADMSTSREYGGTGLGLHIFSEIVELMNGEIIAQGQVGEGSIFGFSATFERAQLPQQLSPAGMPGKIALIDDYAPLRGYLAEALAQAGYPIDDPTSSPPSESAPELTVVSLRAQAANELNIPPAGRYRQRPEQRVIAAVYSADELLCDHLERLGYDGLLPKSSGPVMLRNTLNALFDPQQALAIGEWPSATRPHTRYDVDVLVVDDQHINLQLMTEFLNLLGANAVFVDSGQAALARCQVIHFDLILLDLHMPGLDGFEVVRHLRAAQGLNRNTPALAVTADSHPEKYGQARDAGFNDLLVKPISLAAIEAAIKRWCGNVGQGVIAVDGASLSGGRAQPNLGEELMALLLRDLPYQSEALAKALEAQDAETLAEQAHALDGNARYCDTPALRQAAAALADAARRGWNTRLDALCCDLMREIATLLAASKGRNEKRDSLLENEP